jgi:putative nucleotidyltransferase with HDIG domain
MAQWVSGILKQTPVGGSDRRLNPVQWASVVLAAVIFIAVATLVIAFDNIASGRSNIAALQVGDIAPQDIRAPFDWRYESEVLTERRRQAAMDSTAPVFDPPDPAIARQQVQIVRQILDYIDNVRRDPFGTLDQKVNDIQQISALTLDRRTIEYVLSLSDELWRAMDAETVTVLERVMREEIRESSLPIVRSQLPMQIGVRFNDSDVNAITAIAEDLLRPNTFPNPTATEAARAAAAANTTAETRAFERGQIVIREGARIESVDYEALGQLGLLQTSDRRLTEVARALLTSTLVLVVVTLYLVRFRPDLFRDLPYLFLLEALLLLVLVGARFFSGDNQLYIYPTAALALLLVPLAGSQMAVLGAVTLSVLIGLMASQSLEMATLVLLGGITGALTLRREERLNSFFISGLVVAMTNVIVVTIFNLERIDAGEGSVLGILVLYSIVNGVFAAAVALAGMYAVTLLFNLPTSLKLVELNQPSQPLLQRLLREAPGTYQHSLQVGNLGEQAATAIGANPELVRVAALYHDIGKMLNPAFFVENQADNVNPHDALNDPYRSADIIIGHVTDGDRLARQYRLPTRIRDFIVEHHGTTLVAYFYRRAVDQADDEESVDIDQFMYPGPRPQSRETAILMLADSCESTVRARKPTNKQEIAEIVNQIIEVRMRDGQLDESGLTTDDIKTIRNTFIEMLQAVFHPRINYPSLTPERRSDALPEQIPAEVQATSQPLPLDSGMRNESITTPLEVPVTRTPLTGETPVVRPPVDDDDAPLPEVPPLRRTTTLPEIRIVENGDAKAADQPSDATQERTERE